MYDFLAFTDALEAGVIPDSIVKQQIEDETKNFQDRLKAVLANLNEQIQKSQEMQKKLFEEVNTFLNRDVIKDYKVYLEALTEKKQELEEMNQDLIESNTRAEEYIKVLLENLNHINTKASQLSKTLAGVGKRHDFPNKAEVVKAGAALARYAGGERQGQNNDRRHTSSNRRPV
jgi:DNA repair exonuclease SbcCD ATPase subunit